MKQKPVPIDFFTRLKYPAGLQSDGAGRLCFALKTIDGKANRTRSALWLLKDGAAPAPLPATADTRGHWWAAPGVLLLARGGGKKEKAWQEGGLPFTRLETLDVKTPGAKPRLLAKLFLEVEDAVPLPGGEMVLLARWDPAAEAALAASKGDAEKATARLREENALCTVMEELPFWENGGGFIGKKRRRLYLLRDGKATPLTDEATEVESLRRSPSGGTLWYIASRYTDKMPLENRLFRLDAATLETADCTVDNLSHGRLVPLSDTEALAAGSDMRRHGLNQNPAFYRLTADGVGAPKATTLYSGGRYCYGNSVGTDLAQPAGARWQVAGDTVYWTTTLGESSHLMKLDAAGGAITQLTKADGAVQELALHSGEVVIAAMRGQQPPELYAVAADGTERQLTQFNALECEKYTLAAPKALTATGGDGRKVHGFVLLPPAAAAPASAADGRLPAVFCIHGGPKTVYGAVLHHEMQLLAARGYAVIFCNPLGSDGRGDAFADIRGLYGGPDCDDLLAFLDAALAAHPEIDPARVGVCGGSYGGFMVNWLIGQTARFKAAVSQRSISNWVSMAATSDIGYYFVPSEQGATIWQDAGALWQHSPLRLASRAKTPTLFIHSDADYRCPQSEGIQMYAALKEHGVPARMCLFKGENHELSRSGKPRARLRRLQEILDWFGQYL